MGEVPTLFDELSKTKAKHNTTYLVQVDNIILLDGGVSVLHQLDNCALICWLVLNPSQSTLAVHKLVGFHLSGKQQNTKKVCGWFEMKWHIHLQDFLPR